MKKYNKSCSATVNKLLLTLKEQKTEEGFCEVCKSIKTKEKADMAECIVKKFADFPNYKHMNREEVFNIYTKALLTEAKYLVREKKEKKGVTADE